MKEVKQKNPTGLTKCSTSECDSEKKEEKQQKAQEGISLTTTPPPTHTQHHHCFIHSYELRACFHTIEWSNSPESWTSISVPRYSLSRLYPKDLKLGLSITVLGRVPVFQRLMARCRRLNWEWDVRFTVCRRNWGLRVF